MRRDKTYTGLLYKKACRRYVKKISRKKERRKFHVCKGDIRSPYAAFRPSWTHQRGIRAGTCSLFAHAPQQIAPPGLTPYLTASLAELSLPSPPFAPFVARVLIFQRVSPFHSLQSSASRLFTFIKS